MNISTNSSFYFFIVSSKYQMGNSILIVRGYFHKKWENSVVHNVLIELGKRNAGSTGGQGRGDVQISYH